MAVQLIELEGTVNWAKVFEFNRDKAERATHPGVKETLWKTDGQYSVQVILDKENVDKVSASGSKKKPSITDDGIAFTFTRPHKHPAGISDFGGPPKVVDADENEWPDGVLIGNGSRALVYISVYDTKMGKGTRLEAIKVLDLVEFESEGGESSGIKLPF